jgi:2-oxoglutarate dehydrogenase E2 component (dihydrolipoamide succinyltransferase)
VEEGATVGINAVVGRISDGASAPAQAPAAAAPAPAPAAPAPAAAPAPVAAPAPAAVVTEPAPAEDAAGPLSPLVRKLARENNIDLSKIRGTGAGGRITKQDVEAFMHAPSAPAPAAPVEAAAPPPPAPQPVTAVVQQQQPVHVQQPQAVPARQPEPPPAQMPGAAPGMRVEPMSNMRQKIAQHMVFSKQTSAHVTTVHKVDMSKVAKARDRAKANVQSQYGFSLTFLPFFIRAATAALRQFPIVNASIDGTNIIYHRDINVGIAVALENGLIVPVIRNADEKTVIGLQRSVVDLAARSRSRQLRPDEVQDGTFSITNFGSFGSIFATPVINQPQVAILGLGAVTKEPVVVDDAIAIRSMCYLALTFDHRLIDGALADQFTAKVKHVLENWSEEIM